jgi:putative oxidoreductase
MRGTDTAMDDARSNPRLSAWTPYALAALRVVAGLLFLSHGLVKMFGFPAGAQPGPQPLASLLGAAGAIEVAAGLLIALGLFTRPAAFVASGEMAVAYWMMHAPGGFFPVLNMGEAAILYCFIFLLFVFAGPGALSVDGMLRRRS